MLQLHRHKGTHSLLSAHVTRHCSSSALPCLERPYFISTFLRGRRWYEILEKNHPTEDRNIISILINERNKWENI